MHLQSKFISTVRLIFGEKKRENFYEFNNLNSSKPLIPKHFDDVLLLDWTKLLHYIFFFVGMHTSNRLLQTNAVASPAKMEKKPVKCTHFP